MKQLHGLFDEQTGQQISGAYTYAEIARIAGRTCATVIRADDSGYLVAGRYRVLPDPILAEWDEAREKILYLTRRIDRNGNRHLKKNH